MPTSSRAGRVRALCCLAVSLLLLLALIGFFLHAEHVWEPQTLRYAVRHYGPPALFLFALIETTPLSLVSPGAVTLVIAGALVSRPQTGIGFFVAAALGTILGNILFYVLGTYRGRAIAHRLCLSEERLTVVDRFMRRFGQWSVLLGQFPAGVRPFVSFLAGTTRMKASDFYPWMIVGAMLLPSLYLSIGYLLRGRLHVVLSFIGGGGFLVLLVTFLLFWVLERRLIHRR